MGGASLRGLWSGRRRWVETLTPVNFLLSFRQASDSLFTQQPTRTSELNSNPYTRIEMLVVKGDRTVIVGLGDGDGKVIAVGGEAPGEPIFSAAIPLGAGISSVEEDARQIQFLATHHAPASNQLFFAESLSLGSYLIYCLHAA